MTAAEEAELKELRAWKAKVEPCLNAIYDFLYFDTEKGCFDPNKEYTSACDMVEAIANEINWVYPRPRRGTNKYPAIRGYNPKKGHR